MQKFTLVWDTLYLPKGSFYFVRKFDVAQKKIQITILNWKFLLLWAEDLNFLLRIVIWHNFFSHIKLWQKATFNIVRSLDS